MFLRLTYCCLQSQHPGLQRCQISLVKLESAEPSARMGHFLGTHGRLGWAPSQAAQHTSLAATFLSAPPVLPFPMWQKADRHLLTPIKDSRRHFIDEWVIDGYLLASWEELLWWRILYSSQSSLEKGSSLPFGSVLWSICYVSYRLQLISVEGSDSYVGFTHDSSRQSVEGQA